jgi:signal transduction histidine kinase
MEYYLTALWSALELVALHFFWSAFLEIKCSRKTYFSTLFTAWVLSLVFLNIGIKDIFEQAISFTMFIAISLICYWGSLWRKVLFVVLLFTLGAIVDSGIAYGTSAVLGISLSDLVWKKATYSVVVTIGKLIIIFFAWFTCRFREMRTYEPIRQKWLLLTIPFPTVSLGMLIVVFHGNRDIGDLSANTVFFSILLSASNFAIIYLFDLMEKNATNAKRSALLNQQMDIQTRGIIALEKNYRAQRKATHEYRNQLQTIHDLLMVENKDAALSYIKQLQGMQTTRIFTVNSHHPIIDAVLNQKYQQAQEHDIDVQMQVNDLSSVSIYTDHLVVLLSNLLDNAIEACLRLTDCRAIQCTIILSDSLYLSVRNTSLPVEINGKYIPTSKEPKEDHGYGLPHIDFILNQLHAEYALSCEDGWFEFASEIPHD